MPTNPTAADRKVVLMRLLAEAEADRLGLTPTPQQIRSTTQWWRQQFGFDRLEDLAAWMRDAEMTPARFEGMMRSFTAVVNVQTHYAEAIEARLSDHLAIHTVYDHVRSGAA